MSVHNDLSRYSLDELQAWQYDQNIDPLTALRVTQRLLTNHHKPAVWYYLFHGVESQPLNLIQLKQLVDEGTLGTNDYVWQEGMQEWMQVHSVGVLKTIPVNVPPPITTAPVVKKEGGGKSAMLLAGVLQGVLTFLWVFVAIFQFFESSIPLENKFGGFFFCGVMIVLSIPTTIGLIAGRRWGYVFKLVIGALALLWIFSRLMSGRNNEAWILLIVVDSVILTLALLNTRNYN